MREENIDFQQCTNAFLKCSNPARLQELADSLTAQDLVPVRPEMAGRVHSVHHRQGTQSRLAVSIVCSSPRWSIATT